MQKKTIAVMQPYFLPYIGTFQLMGKVDEYVILDDVNYFRGFVNRNTFEINGVSKFVGIKLNSKSQNKLISEIELLEDPVISFEKISVIYKNAKHNFELMELIEKLSVVNEKNIGKFNGECIRMIASYFCLNANIIYSSDLNYDRLLKGQHKILDICKILSANSYINPIGGIDLYSNDLFFKNNVNLNFFQSSPIENEFYSILHDLANYGRQFVISKLNDGIIVP